LASVAANLQTRHPLRPRRVAQVLRRRARTRLKSHHAPRRDHPGFAADCRDTLEEIGAENPRYFREAGGERFAAIPCLNDSAEGMAVIEALARRELKGWAG
jgi:hypothetical protein